MKDNNFVNKLRNVKNEEELAALSKEVISVIESENTTMGALFDVTPAAQEEIYAIAHSWYGQGRYTQAQDLFSLLVTLSPKSYNFTFGLASCFYQKKDYKSAAIIFYFALENDPTNPMPAYFAADCFIRTAEKELALECLDYVLNLADEENLYSHVKERCRLLKNNLTLMK